MSETLRLLQVEDSEGDAATIVKLLEKAAYGVTWARVETGHKLRDALMKQTWDLIISDYRLPQFDAPAALAVLQRTGLDIPFIVVSDDIGEDIAVSMMKNGAQDYLLKANLARLVPAVARELADARSRRERQKAELALKESQAQLRGIIDSAMDAIITIDEDHCVVLFNPAAEAMFRCSAHEAIGELVERFIPLRLRAGHSEQVRKFAQTRVSKRRIYVPGAMSGLRADGTEFPAEASISQVSVFGNRYFTVIMRDITQREQAANEVRQSEARLINAQRIAKMGNWELDIVHDKLRWSDQIFEIFGIDKTQFGNSFEAFLQCVHPQDRARMKAAQQAAVAGAASLDIEHRIVLPDGTIKIVHELGDLTRDSQGRPVQLAGTVLDITERQHTAEAILQAKQRLQVLSTRMLDIQETERRQFAHELHDEIGQSLTAIKISLQSLHRRLHDDEARKRLEDIMDLAGQTLAQVRSMSIDLRPPQLDDLGLAAALRWNLGRQAAAGGFEAHFHSDLPAGRLASMIETTGYRISQEALTNVVKHAHAKNVTLRAEIRSGELYIVVQDDGRGFDVEGGRQAATDGFGFGLLGMEERVALAGGRLRIHSVATEGTRVEMWLPATPASSGKVR